MSTSCFSNAGVERVPERTFECPSQREAASRLRSQDTFVHFASACWTKLRTMVRTGQAAKKHLRVCETAPLGDKRFVAVIQVDEERFLIGGAANSVALLSRLSAPATLTPANSQEDCRRSGERQ